MYKKIYNKNKKLNFTFSVIAITLVMQACIVSKKNKELNCSRQYTYS